MARSSFFLRIRLETHFVNHLEKEKVNPLDPSFKQRTHKGGFKVMRMKKKKKVMRLMLPWAPIHSTGQQQKS